MKTLTLKIRLFCLALCLITVGRLWAQHELTGLDFPPLLDTLSVKPIYEIKDNREIQSSYLNGLVYPKPTYQPEQLPINGLTAPLLKTPAFVCREPTFTPGKAIIADWRGGAFIAGGQIYNMPGLMDIASGQLGIGQQFGNLTLYVGGVANKYGYLGGLHTQYGIEANATYRLSPQWSINAWGWYYPGNSLPTMPGSLIAPMSIMGYFQSTQFRLTANYQVNGWLGIETGAKVEHLYGTNQYEALPVVTPYFTFGSGNRKVRVGIPVGEIMYRMLRNYSGKNNNGGIRTTQPWTRLR